MTCLLNRLGLALVPLALILGLSACESDESAVDPAAPAEFVVTATDYAFDAADEVPAGMTKVTVQNEGQDLHQATLVKLADGKNFADLMSAMETGALEFPDWATTMGGPVASAPTQSASAFVDLTPGSYALLCNIPNAEGTPHAALGQARALTVVASDAPAAAAPADDATIGGEDFAFVVDESLPAGDHVLRFENTGEQPHEAVLLKLDEGATASDVAMAFAPGGSGQPPAMPVGGVGGIMPGTAQSFPASLSPGRYGLLCFFIDPASGKTHAELGMMSEFDVE
jgi:hypothetical protein